MRKSASWDRRRMPSCLLPMRKWFLSVVYGRASLLRERLSAAVELRTLVDEPGTLVLDPDSRLTQLGLIPICDDARYYFFESRAFGGNWMGRCPI